MTSFWTFQPLLSKSVGAVSKPMYLCACVRVCMNVYVHVHLPMRMSMRRS